LIALQRQQVTAQEAYIRAARSSIVRRLVLRNMKRQCTFNKADVASYRKEFSEEAPRPLKIKGAYSMDMSPQSDDEIGVPYYFLGDIIYTLMDCLYLPSDGIGSEIEMGTYDPEKDNVLAFTKRIPETENFKILLSSFTFTDYTKEQTYFTCNIADVPIAASFFNDWMTENVIKVDRTVYPLMEMIKDLLRAVVDLFTDACINKRVDSSLMFQTGQFMAAGGFSDKLPSHKAAGIVKKKLKVDPFYPAWNEEKGDDELVAMTPSIPIFVDNFYKNNRLPLKTVDEDINKMIPTADLYKYALIYPVSPVLSVTHQGRGRRIKDEKEGTYHFQIGSNKGLLKNMSFSKSDMAYLREARFYNQGAFGLLQLGAVYNVDLDLFGNTLFYPGMEIFIDPRGFGGTDWDPTTGGLHRSTANALGIGGYHIITKVQSTITPSSFNTKVSALFQYSGDGESRSIAITGKATAPPTKSNIKKKVTKGSVKCVKALNAIVADTLIASED
jgi:hypothetical protein